MSNTGRYSTSACSEFESPMGAHLEFQNIIDFIVTLEKKNSDPGINMDRFTFISAYAYSMRINSRWISNFSVCIYFRIGIGGWVGSGR